MANFPTNPSIGDLFETKHDTFKWNGSAWEALGRILTHRQKSGTPYSSLSIKESGGVLDTDDTSTVLLVGEQLQTGQVKAAHSSDADTKLLTGEIVASGLSEHNSDGNTALLIGEVASSGITEHVNDADTKLLIKDNQSISGLNEITNSDGDTLLLVGKGDKSGLPAHTSDLRTSLLATGERDASNYQMRCGLSADMVMRRGYSFDGSGDYLEFSDHSDWSLGTGDFTIEFWVNFSNISSYTVIMSAINDSAGFYRICWSPSSGWRWSNTASGQDFADSISTDTWYHIAVVRSNGVIKFYRDGTQIGSDHANTVDCDPSGGIRIGRQWGSGGDYLNGYLDDFRISKGVARYSGDFKTRVTTKDSSHKLILDGKRTDSSDSNHTVNYNGNAHEVSKTGNSSWHKYGSGDKGYIRSYDSIDLDGDFTIEWWYLAKATGTQHMFTIGDSQQGSGLEFYQGGDGQKLYSGGGYIWTGGGFVSADTWYHFAVVRSSGVVKVYRDGTQIGNDWSTNTTFTGPIGLGVEWYGGTGYRNGAEAYYDDFTIHRSAKYTSAFTPSTDAAPLIGDFGTLFKATKDYDSSSSMHHTIGFGGSATTVEKAYTFGGNNSDYMTVPQAAGTFAGDFTVECWVYLESGGAGASDFLCKQGPSGQTGWCLGRGYTNNRKIWWHVAGSTWNPILSHELEEGRWYHVAGVRDNGTNKLYIDGVFIGSNTTSYTEVATPVAIGNDNGTSGWNRGFKGKIRDIRLSNIVRYTGNENNSGAGNESNYTLKLMGDTIDESSNSYAVTFNGGADVTAKRSDRSMHFNGSSGTYVTYPSSDDFLPGTGAFTAECWLKTTRSTRSRALSHYGSGGTNKGWYLDVQDGKAKFFAGNGSSWVFNNGSTTINDGEWHHVAVVFTGSDYYLFVDGTSEATGSCSLNINPESNLDFRIGNAHNMDWNQHFDGYIDEVRLSKEARYTSNFALETVSDTLVDLSSSAHSLTINGDARQIKKGYYFDDTAHMSVADSSDFDFSGGDSFCVELWMNCKSFSSSNSGYAYMCTQSWSNNGFEIGTWENGRVVIFIGHGAWQLNASNQGSATMQSSTLLSTDTWHHVALTYDGTTYTLYVDGVSQQTHDGNPPSYGAGNAQLTFGSAREDNVNYTFDGYLTNMRITKGETVYSSNFTPAEILTEGANTKLLLLGDTTDSSSQEHSLTFSGGATSTAKFTNGLQFDGDGDYIDIPGSSDFNFGTSDFTIEFWMKTSETGADPQGYYRRLWMTDGPTANANDNLQIVINHSQNSGVIHIQDEADLFYCSTRVTDDVWHHVAVVRESNQLKVYVDGSLETMTGTTSYSSDIGANLNGGSPRPRIGSFNSTQGNYNGHIDNIRISKTARYTSNFTAVDEIGVSDKSSNGHSVSLAGDAATSTTQKKFGTHSITFDGSGDYVEVPASSDFDFGTNGDFTIEMWVYFNSFGNHNMLANQWSQDSGHTGDWQMFFRNSNNGQLEFFYRSSGSWADKATTTTAVALNTWTHLAIVRSSGTIKFYFNGVADSATITNSGQMGDPSKALRIGRTLQPDHNLNGYVDDFRVSNTARYTSNFYVDAGTYISDKSSNSHSMTLSGNASISTAQKKFGDHSLYFDGSGDYVDVPADASLSLTGDFTIEMWTRLENSGANYPFQVSSSNYYVNGKNGNWYFGLKPGNITMYSYDGTGNAESVSIDVSTSYDTWYHIAAVRSGSTVTLYLDGVPQGSGTISKSLVDGADGGLDIGRLTIYGDFKGYIDDFRISDTARYSGRFYVDAGTYVQDKGPDSRSLTLGGDAIPSTADKKFGTHSLSFDGDGDYVDVPASSDFNFGTGDFTIEMWMKTSTTNNDPDGWYRRLFKLDGGTANSGPNVQLAVAPTGATSPYVDGTLWLWVNDSTYASAGSGYTIYDGEWHHIAVVRSSGVLKAYIDGSEKYSVAFPDDLSSVGGGTPAPRIGSHTATLGNYNGYIDDVRVSNTARYTSSFVLEDVTTPIDKKGTHTLTLNGDALIASSGSNEETKFGTGAIKFDSNGDYVSIPNHSSFELGTGDFTIETWIKPGNISATHNRHFVSHAGYNGSDYGNRAWSMCILTNGHINFSHYWGTSDITNVEGTTALSNGTWYHVAVVRSSGTINLYINGVLERSTASAQAMQSTTADLYIGSTFWSVLNDNWNADFEGCMDEFRISTSARYTGAFTPQLAEHDFVDVKGWGSPALASGQTALFVNKNGLIMKSSDGTVTKMDTTSITGGQLKEGSAPASNSKPTLYVQGGEDSNTKLLFVGDSLTCAMGKTSETTEQISVDTAVKHFGDSSLNFSQENTDYFKLDDHEDFHIGTSDFTIETWIRGKSGNSDGINPIFYMYDGTVDNRFQLYTSSGKFMFFYRQSGTTQIGFDSPAASYSDQSWIHVALTRVSGTWKLYINGVDQTLSFWDSSNATSAPDIQNFPATKGPYIGYSWSGTSYYAHYNLQNFRFSKVARYTSNFTPSTDSFGSGGLFYRDPSGVKTKIS